MGEREGVVRESRWLRRRGRLAAEAREWAKEARRAVELFQKHLALNVKSSSEMLASVLDVPLEIIGQPIAQQRSRALVIFARLLVHCSTVFVVVPGCSTNKRVAWARLGCL